MSDPLPPVRPLPSASAATNGGKNNAASLPAGALTRAMFADVVEQVERKPEPEHKESTTSAAQVDPENTEEQPSSEQPGEETLTAEESAAGEQPTEEATGESEEPTSGNPELDAALQGLNEDARKHLVEIAQAIAAGETTIGQVKRQFKLGKQENEELTQLRQKVQELESRPATTATTGQLPEAVAKLKSLDEVDARQDMAETAMAAIENFLEDNPQGGKIGDQEFTRDQLVARKRAWQEELRALPKQAKALQAQQQLTQAQQTVKTEVLKDYPYYGDATNPDAKLAQELIQNTPPLNAFPNRDYLALALARGHRELQAEKAARVAGKKPPVKPAVQTSRPGTVPAGKPHASAGAMAKAPARPVSDLVKAVKDKDSLADLLAATGR